MNNKMAVNTYVSTVESKKIFKQNRNRIIHTGNVLVAVRREGYWRMFDKVKGLRSTNW